MIVIVAAIVAIVPNNCDSLIPAAALSLLSLGAAVGFQVGLGTGAGGDDGAVGADGIAPPTGDAGGSSPLGGGDG